MSRALQATLFFLLLSLGVYLRFHALDRQSLWAGEMTTIEQLAAPGLFGSPYLLQLKAWHRLGAKSLVKLRANSAFWGTAFLVALTLFGFWLGGTRAALAALSLGAFSPFLLALSQDLRSPAAGPWGPLGGATAARTLGACTGLSFPFAASYFYLPTIVGVFIFLAAVWLWVVVRGALLRPIGLLIWLALTLFWAPPVLVYPAFLGLAALGLSAFESRWAAAALAALCLASQLWGAVIYFGRWQKANTKAVVSYVHRRREPDQIVVRPARFGPLFQFYDQGSFPAVDEEVLADPAKRAALHGKRLVFIALDSDGDPVGDALLREFKPVAARRFPALAPWALTVYQLQ